MHQSHILFYTIAFREILKPQENNIDHIDQVYYYPQQN